MRLPRVLVVEDEPRMAELLLRAVNAWGFAARWAGSGEEALRLMDKEPAQVLVLDINLPGMSGLEALERVRGRWPGVAAIVLTGFGDLEMARRAIHLDATEFLTKPCPMGELERALEKARRRLQDAGAAEPPIAAAAAGQGAAEFEPADAESGAGAGTLAEVERQHILSVLARHAGNRAAAAAELGISLRTLYYRLREYRG